MAQRQDGFVTAVDPGGNKRQVPEHYLDNPAFAFKLPPSARKKAQWVEEPAASANTTTTVKEPAQPDDKEEASS